MTYPNKIFLLAGGLLLALLPLRAAADPAGDFFKAQAAASTRLLTGAAAGAALRQPGPDAGRVVEATAIVSGMVAVGEERTALLNTTSATGSVSISLPVPAGLRGRGLAGFRGRSAGAAAGGPG